MTTIFSNFKHRKVLSIGLFLIIFPTELYAFFLIYIILFYIVLPNTSLYVKYISEFFFFFHFVHKKVLYIFKYIFIKKLIIFEIIKYFITSLITGKQKSQESHFAETLSSTKWLLRLPRLPIMSKNWSIDNTSILNPPWLFILSADIILFFPEYIFPAWRLPVKKTFRLF